MEKVGGVKGRHGRAGCRNLKFPHGVASREIYPPAPVFRSIWDSFWPEKG